jgi:hypothetical protein
VDSVDSARLPRADSSHSIILREKNAIGFHVGKNSPTKEQISPFVFRRSPVCDGFVVVDSTDRYILSLQKHRSWNGSGFDRYSTIIPEESTFEYPA